LCPRRALRARLHHYGSRDICKTSNQIKIASKVPTLGLKIVCQLASVNGAASFNDGVFYRVTDRHALARRTELVKHGLGVWISGLLQRSLNLIFQRVADGSLRQTKRVISTSNIAVSLVSQRSCGLDCVRRVELPNAI
jgi:hypothetical protein